MRKALVWCTFLALTLTATALVAQDRKAASPHGMAATQIGDHWIEVDYSRPILRGRTDIFGTGDTYGEKVSGGAPVWRVGANQTTRLKTETDLMFGESKVPAGEYSVFVSLDGADKWTLILSNWGAQKTYNRDDKENLWGSYGYTADKDVARVSMTVESADISIDQFTIVFANVSDEGGTLVMGWEHTMALAPFTVAK